MEVFRANHGTLRRTLGDPDLQVMHRILGSDSPLQGELLSYLMFDPDFFDEVGGRWASATPSPGWRPTPTCGAPGRATTAEEQ